MSVLVIDSGIGGLTILDAIKKTLPKVSTVYVADHAYFPYGNKTQAQLEERLVKIIDAMSARYQFDTVVIACNSASTLVLNHLRDKYAYSFVGVVPAIKPAAQLSKTKRIGVIATEGTINGNYLQDLVDEFASDCFVFKLATPQLVKLAEDKYSGEQVDQSVLKNIVEKLTEQNIDVCVLGCTHFPWFKQELCELAPSIEWIDSSEAVAKQVMRVTEFVSKQEVEHGVYSTVTKNEFHFFELEK